MAKKALTTKIQNWATGSGVLPAVDPMVEYNASASYTEVQHAVYDAIAEITSSTVLSGSTPRTLFGSLTRTDYPAAVRINDAIWASSLRAGSVLVHHDPASGSFICVSGSFYNMMSSSAHGKTHNERFNLLEATIEHRMDFRIASKKGITVAKAEASASYTGSINAIKALPS